MIFLGSNVAEETSSSGFVRKYKSAVVQNIVELSKSSDLIGISLSTNYFDGIADLTLQLKEKISPPCYLGRDSSNRQPLGMLGICGHGLYR